MTTRHRWELSTLAQLIARTCFKRPVAAVEASINAPEQPTLVRGEIHGQLHPPQTHVVSSFSPLSMSRSLTHYYNIDPHRYVDRPRSIPSPTIIRIYTVCLLYRTNFHSFHYVVSIPPHRRLLSCSSAGPEATHGRSAITTELSCV